MIFFLISINVIVLSVEICLFLYNCDVSFSFVNPIVIYNNLKLTWFLTIVISIAINLILPVISIPYWIYKLLSLLKKVIKS